MFKPRNFASIFTFIIVLITFVLLGFSKASLQVKCTSDLETNKDNLLDIIKACEDKIQSLKGTAQTLQKEIEYTNSQISLTELRIQNSISEINKKTKQIERLSSDIDDLKVRIKRLEESISFQEKIFGERLRARYKSKETSPIIIIFGSATIDKIIQKSEYLKVMGIQDKKLLNEMNSTKQSYGFQKDLFEKKKSEEEVLRAAVLKEKANREAYNSQLAVQKAERSKLLEVTKNDEQKYQALLAQVKSELAALEFANNLPAGKGEEVKEGDTIGYIGNTGCSSGPHVHFGYIKNGKARDPLPKLKSGYLKWPVKNYQITQYFGENYNFYMNNFGIPGHDALDIIDTKVWVGSPIKAVKDGLLYYAKDSEVYCPWLNNTLGNGAIIDHGNGEKTFYWHLR